MKVCDRTSLLMQELMGFISLCGLSALLISEQILNNNEDTAGRTSQMLGQFETADLQSWHTKTQIHL